MRGLKNFYRVALLSVSYTVSPLCPGLGGGFILTGALVAESQGCRNHTGRGATFVKNGQMLLKHLSWIGKIVKIYEMFLKKLHFW